MTSVPSVSGVGKARGDGIHGEDHRVRLLSRDDVQNRKGPDHNELCLSREKMQKVTSS